MEEKDSIQKEQSSACNNRNNPGTTIYLGETRREVYNFDNKESSILLEVKSGINTRPLNECIDDDLVKVQNDLTIDINIKKGEINGIDTEVGFIKREKEMVGSQEAMSNLKKEGINEHTSQVFHYANKQLNCVHSEILSDVYDIKKKQNGTYVQETDLGKVTEINTIDGKLNSTIISSSIGKNTQIATTTIWKEETVTFEEENLYPLQNSNTNEKLNTNSSSLREEKNGIKTEPLEEYSEHDLVIISNEYFQELQMARDIIGNTEIKTESNSTLLEEELSIDDEYTVSSKLPKFVKNKQNVFECVKSDSEISEIHETFISEKGCVLGLKWKTYLDAKYKYQCPYCKVVINKNFYLHCFMHVMLNYHKSFAIDKSIKMVCKQCKEEVQKQYLLSHYEHHSLINIEPRVVDFPKSLLGAVLEDLKRKETLIEHLYADTRANKDANGGLLCQICTKLLRDKCIYKNHMLQHASPPIYECKVCKMIYKGRAYFINHQKKHVSVCVQGDNCEGKFTSKQDLIHHLRKKYQTKIRIPCEICKTSFHSESLLDNHIKLVHEKDEVFPSIGQMKKPLITYSRSSKSKKSRVLHETAASPKEAVIRECSVLLKRCDFPIEGPENVENSVPAESHGVLPKQATTAKPSHPHDNVQNHDEVPSVLIKKECDDKDSVSVQDLDIGHTQVRQDSSADTYLDMTQNNDEGPSVFIKKECDDKDSVSVQDLDIGHTQVRQYSSADTYLDMTQNNDEGPSVFIKKECDDKDSVSVQDLDIGHTQVRQYSSADTYLDMTQNNDEGPSVFIKKECDDKDSVSVQDLDIGHTQVRQDSSADTYLDMTQNNDEGPSVFIKKECDDKDSVSVQDLDIGHTQVRQYSSADTYLDMTQNHDEVPSVLIKKECDDKGSVSVQDLDIGHTQVRQDSSADTYLDMTQNHDEVPSVLIKKECDDKDSVSVQDLDIGHTQVRQDSSADTYLDMTQNIQIFDDRLGLMVSDHEKDEVFPSIGQLKKPLITYSRSSNSKKSRVFHEIAASPKEAVIRECSVLLKRCDLPIEGTENVENSVPAESHWVLLKQATTTKPSHPHNNVQNNDEGPSMFIKKECDDKDSVSVQDLDIGHTQVRQDSSADTFLDITQDRSPILLPGTSSGKNATPMSRATNAIQTDTRAKVEDHYYEDNYKELVVSNSSLVVNMNTVDNADEGTSPERTCTSMASQKEGRCMSSVKPLAERDCRTDTSNAKYVLHKCEHCEYVTNRKTQLIKHVRRHVNEKLYSCDQCEYSAFNLCNLQRHTRKHNSQKPYNCEYCAYSAYDRSYLRIHTRKHTGEKPYSCDRCQYSVSYLHNLQRHMRKHTGEKPYSCDRCEYRASQLSYLQRHMRRHTGEKPYSCDQCEYRASHLHHLQRHMCRHTDDKPYSCDQCKYSASHLYNLQRHMRKHTGEKPYSCRYCCYSTYEQDYLRKHMRNALHVKRGFYEDMCTNVKKNHIQSNRDKLKPKGNTKYVKL